MSTALQVISLAVVCAVLCVLLRERTGTLAMLLTLTVCVCALLVMFRFFTPILDFAARLRQLSGLSDSVTAPLLKVTGMGLLTQVACGLCEDAGEKALARTVEICGSVFAVYVSLPLMTAVVELLESMLGG